MSTPTPSHFFSVSVALAFGTFWRMISSRIAIFWGSRIRPATNTHFASATAFNSWRDWQHHGDASQPVTQLIRFDCWRCISHFLSRLLCSRWKPEPFCCSLGFWRISDFNHLFRFSSLCREFSIISCYFKLEPESENSIWRGKLLCLQVRLLTCWQGCRSWRASLIAVGYDWNAVISFF